uniref:Uncharacterized protein n=1 Tax=Anguilla anguilla TaxID=7936 RepID=A0A0E9XP77_ANGAN
MELKTRAGIPGPRLGSLIWVNASHRFTAEHTFVFEAFAVFFLPPLCVSSPLTRTTL